VAFGQGLTTASITVSPFDRLLAEPGVSPGRPHQLLALWASALARQPDAAFPLYMALRSKKASLRTAEPSRKAHVAPCDQSLYIASGVPRNRRGLTTRDAPRPMINDVYNSKILELAGNIPRLGRLDAPDASATAHSKLCGSTVTVDLAMDGDEITDFAHEVKACALGQASSSIMARHVLGAKAGELRDLREAVRKMLKENGAPPDGKWADVAVLEPVRDYKARHASTLLTFDAVVDAINQIEAKRRQAQAAE
jgi:NifU-like protein involved in Fe-S cluster formation